MKKHLLLVLLVLVLKPIPTMAQYSLSGIVNDMNKLPLTGVIITIENTKLHFVSSENGSFTIPGLKTGKYKLHFKLLGYEDKFTEVNMPGEGFISVVLKSKEYLTDEVTISAHRTGGKAGMAVSMLDKEEIEKLNTGQDLPYLLQSLASTVVTSDAGNGIGYTGIRIRGSDAGRINVTINGIPLNDSESQLVYWVNMPDFASSTENIEVTRGAGTSTNGTSAFGGSINIQTQQLSDSAYAQSSNGFGSFNTWKNNVSFGSGLISRHLVVEGRLSAIRSDGFIDRGSSDLKSAGIQAAWKSRNNILRFNLFTGKEITYQSWYGVPESRISNNRQAMLDYSIRNGLSEDETANLLNSGRTYNYYTYDDQTDNYQQDHYQLITAHSLSNNWLLNIALHATRGRGFYEEYKNNQTLSDYNISPIILNDTMISESDLIRRRWLDNLFYGGTWTLQGTPLKRLSVILGGAINRYDGDHFGEVIWARYAGNSEIRKRYYFDNAIKDDFTGYLKSNWEIHHKLNLFLDLQLRLTDYTFAGPVMNSNTVTKQRIHHTFFNPKMGITFQPEANLSLYASVAVANKEPNREDYTGSSSFSRPDPERLIDYETGVKWNTNSFQAVVNLYYMDYYDQLVLNGKINDVGSYTRININRSYRTGVEIESALQLHPQLLLQGNLTLSDNRIKDFTEFIDQYDADFNYLGQKRISYRHTAISFSPALTGAGQLNYTPFRHSSISFIYRHVSKQYLDNTESEESIIPAYSTADVRLSFTPSAGFCKKIRADILLNNIFDTVFESNGYTWGYIYNETRIRENFYYPQAGFNIMGQLTLRF